MDIPETLILNANKSATLLGMLKDIAGFELPKSTKKKFQSFHAHITAKPQLKSLAHLDSGDKQKRSWSSRFTNTVLCDVQEGIAACYYHLEMVNKIENEIINLSKEIVPILQFYPGSLGGGNIRCLDFEYQAFAFAIRRTLDYFAKSVAEFFKSDAHQFSKLTKTIRDKSPECTRDRIIATLDQTHPTISDLLSLREDQRSIRDKLAHWKAVGTGGFHLIITEKGKFVNIPGVRKSSRTLDKKFLEELTGFKFELAVTSTLHDQLSCVESMIFQIYSDMGLVTLPKS